MLWINYQNFNDQVELLKTIEKAKGAEYSELLDLIISVLKSEIFEKYSFQKCLSRANLKDEQSLSSISKVLEWINSRTVDELEVACLDFWKQTISLLDTLKDKDNYRMINDLSPLDIRKVACAVSKSELGAEATGLIEQCAVCIRTRAEKYPNPLHEAQNSYANAYLTVYKKVNGANMEAFDGAKPSSKHILAIEPQLVIDLLNSEQSVLEIEKRDMDVFAKRKENIITLFNSKIIEKLQEERSKTGEDFDKLDKMYMEINDLSYFHLLIRMLFADQKETFPKLLDMYCINHLISIMHSTVYYEWKPELIAKQASLAEVTNLFDEFIKDVKNKTAEQQFLDAATEYAKDREQHIMNQIKTSLQL